MTVNWEIEFNRPPNGAGIEVGRLAGGPDHRAIMRLESILMRYFAEVEAHVHVISGRLRASGHPESSFDGVTWRGTHSFGGPAAPYAIYELARGNRPSLTHPEGGHYFFAPDDASRPEYEAAVMDWVAGR